MIEYEHLLGIPFLYGSSDPKRGGIDCAGVCEILFRSQGIDISADVFRTPGHPEHERFRKISLERNGWRPLDVICSDPEKTGAVSHISCVLTPGVGGLAISSARGFGVFAPRVDSLRNVISAWRLEE